MNVECRRGVRPKTGFLLVGGYMCKTFGPIQKGEWLRCEEAEDFIYEKEDILGRGIGLLKAFVAPALQEEFPQLIFDMTITVNPQGKLELDSDIAVFFLLEGRPWKFATHIATLSTEKDLILNFEEGTPHLREWDREWFVNRVLHELATTFTKLHEGYKILKKKGRSDVNELYQKMFEIHIISSFVQGK